MEKDEEGQDMEKDEDDEDEEEEEDQDTDEEEDEGCPQFCEMDTYEISHRCLILALFRTSMRCSS